MGEVKALCKSLGILSYSLTDAHNLFADQIAPKQPFLVWEYNFELKMFHYGYCTPSVHTKTIRFPISFQQLIGYINGGLELPSYTVSMASTFDSTYNKRSNYSSQVAEGRIQLQLSLKKDLAHKTRQRFLVRQFRKHGKISVGTKVCRKTFTFLNEPDSEDLAKTSEFLLRGAPYMPRTVDGALMLVKAFKMDFPVYFEEIGISPQQQYEKTQSFQNLLKSSSPPTPDLSSDEIMLAKMKGAKCGASIFSKSCGDYKVHTVNRTVTTTLKPEEVLQLHSNLE